MLDAVIPDAECGENEEHAEVGRKGVPGLGVAGDVEQVIEWEDIDPGKGNDKGEELANGLGVDAQGVL